jgi:HSP20 family protein
MFELIPFEKRANSIFDVFNSMEKAMASTPAFSGFRCDIKDMGDHFLMEAELPGFARDAIDIDVNDKTLTISAERNEVKEETDENGQFLRRERSYGSFKRSFDITGVEASAINAKYENGILSLSLPKEKELIPEAHKVEIQ